MAADVLCVYCQPPGSGQRWSGEQKRMIACGVCNGTGDKPRPKSSAILRGIRTQRKAK